MSQNTEKRSELLEGSCGIISDFLKPHSRKGGGSGIDLDVVTLLNSDAFNGSTDHTRVTVEPTFLPDGKKESRLKAHTIVEGNFSLSDSNL